MAELKVGIVTQCLAVNNISDSNKFESVIGNLILKLHAKLNGINHIVQAPAEHHKEFSVFQREAVMVLGADVTHPSPGGGNVRLLNLLCFHISVLTIMYLLINCLVIGETTQYCRCYSFKWKRRNAIYDQY